MWYSVTHVGTLSRIKIPFFLSSIYTDELISTRNVIKFLSNSLPFDKGKLPRASNLRRYPEYEYLSGSEFVANLTAPNKEFPNAKSLSTLNSHRSISYAIKIFTTCLCVNVILSSFKQLPSTRICNLELI